MKLGTHPEYQEVVATCRCGVKMTLTGTYKQIEFPVETCYQCHPAYTGKQPKHSAGSIDKFAGRFGGFMSATE